MTASLSARIGRRTVFENLEWAVNTGAVTRLEDGTFVVPLDTRGIKQKITSHVPWVYPCTKLKFLFEHAYDRSQVPYTCRNCYKVKVRPKTVSELLAVHDATVHKPYPSKFQPEINVTHSSDLYGAYFYADGLEQARKIYSDVRATLDSDCRLNSMPMEIRRGCVYYELYCGPSDQYTFPDDLPALEAHLLDKISVARSPHAQKPPRSFIIVQWIQMAYQIGDESYLELNGGRRLFPKAVTYDP